MKLNIVNITRGTVRRRLRVVIYSILADYVTMISIKVQRDQGVRSRLWIGMQYKRSDVKGV